MFKKHYIYQEALEDELNGGGGANPPADPPSDPPADPPSDPPASDPVDDPVAKDPSDPPADPAADPADPPKEEVKGYWPEDWRKQIAGDDEKLLSKLGRYASPAEVSKALVAAQSKISSGNLTSKLPENPTDEQVAEWRKDNGIPESADGYEFTTPVDPEKEFGYEVAKEVMHKHNLTPEQANAMRELSIEMQEAAMEDRREKDAQLTQDNIDLLREEYGTEYRRNMNMVHNLMDTMMDEEVKKDFFGGRMADGTPIGSHPEVLKMLVRTSLIHNPAGTVVPNAGGDQLTAVSDEIESIQKIMREDRGAYDRDEKMQNRYRELIAARESLKPNK